MEILIFRAVDDELIRSYDTFLEMMWKRAKFLNGDNFLLSKFPDLCFRYSFNRKPEFIKDSIAIIQENMNNLVQEYEE